MKNSLNFVKFVAKYLIFEKNVNRMLNAGVLGAGHLGKIHLRLLNESTKYNLVGFYDANEENGKKVEAEFGY